MKQNKNKKYSFQIFKNIFFFNSFLFAYANFLNRQLIVINQIQIVIFIVFFEIKLFFKIDVFFENVVDYIQNFRISAFFEK